MDRERRARLLMASPEPTRLRRPLFVTGMERSGTKLLGAMLSGHSAISRTAPPFVTNLFLAWPAGVPNAGELDRFLDNLYGETRFKASPVPREAVRDRLRSLLPLGFRELAAELVAAHSADAGKPDYVYWIDRTPWFVPILHAKKVEFDRALGDYRLVAIVRDGRAVLSSVLRAQATRGYGFRTDVFHLAAHWRKAATLGELFSGAGQYHEVRYEELVTRPTEVLELVCRFLDLPYEPGMLDYQGLHVAAPIHRLLAAPPRPERAEAWHAEGDARLLRIFDLMARAELRRSGYPPFPPSLRRSSLAVGAEALSYWLETQARKRLSRVLGRTRARTV